MNDPARESVWLALSELWLDTETTEATISYIADTLVVSGFPLDELEAIYRFEVVPAVYSNALTTAGEWAGFDADWLFGECRFHRGRRAYFPYRWLCWLLSKTLGGMMSGHFRQVMAQVAERRELIANNPH